MIEFDFRLGVYLHRNDKPCQKCIHYDEHEHYVPPVCDECTRFGHTTGTVDNWQSKEETPCP